jgi:SAM-dependent methyltransferase
MHLDLHYVDPRLVALYDTDNPRGADTDFYVDLADELMAQTLIDLGCGTGLLTRELATPERRVFGVEPAGEMLTYARRQPGAERVIWIHGDAAAIQAWDADLLLMTGNVAQVFLDDTDWMRVLTAAHASLRKNGRITFESRNPNARGWESWNRAQTYGVSETPYGQIESWYEVKDVQTDRVRFVGYKHFTQTGEVLEVESTLKFRTREGIEASLNAAGFEVAAVYGDFQRGPFQDDSKAMVFVAKRM